MRRFRYKQEYQETEVLLNLPKNFLFLDSKDVNLPPHLIPDTVCFFSVRKVNNILEYHVYPTRDKSILHRIDDIKCLIEAAVQDYIVNDFNWILICYDDKDWRSYTYEYEPSGLYLEDAVENLASDNSIRDIKYSVFSACTKTNFWAETIPDFVYYYPKMEYEQLTSWLLECKHEANNNTLGWRGSGIVTKRHDIAKLSKIHNYDCEIGNNNNYISIRDQILRWRYLIDLEGFGYSGRLKILLHAPRVVFIEERNYKEDFFQWLTPWVHYVPVKNDLSDLNDNLELIKSSPVLENYIIDNAQEFARTHLSRSAAIKRMANKLNSLC